MTQQNLKNAYPSLSPEGRGWLHNVAERAASDAAQKASQSGAPQRPPRQKLSLGLVIALILLLALMGIAYAAVQLGIIDYLIGPRETPSAELISSAQAFYNVKGEANDLLLTITGGLYDGERLSLSWTLENKKPEAIASICLKGVTFGGEWTDAKFSSISQTAYDDWAPSAFGMQEVAWSRNPQIGGMLTDPLGQPYSGMQEVVVELGISRPKKPLVVLAPRLLENLGIQDDPVLLAETQYLQDSLIASQVTIADAQHQDPGYWWDMGYMVLDEGGNIKLPEDVTDYIWAWEASDSPYRMDLLMEDTAPLVIRFSMNAGDRRSYLLNWTLAEGSMECQLPRCTVQVKKLFLTPLTTRLHYQMIPDENTEEAARWLAETYGWAELRDEQGRELAFSGMESEYGPTVGWTEDGRWMMECDWSLPGLNLFPKEVHLVAGDYPFQEGPLTEEQAQARMAFAEKMMFVISSR